MDKPPVYIVLDALATALLDSRRFLVRQRSSAQQAASTSFQHYLSRQGRAKYPYKTIVIPYALSKTQEN
jgi:hypothetical protein